jgi:hypothetical protein
MFKKEKINEIFLATLGADSYSLGAHWIYDEKQLKELDINWDDLNAPKAMWHAGKKAGDLTHIGDQAYFLMQYLKDKDSFDELDYLKFWQAKMSVYDGYIDGATRETLENIANKKFIGSNSHDFSIIGRITPLLLVSKNEEDFIKNVKNYVKMSHDDANVLEVAEFFARLILKVKDGANIKEQIVSLADDFSSFVKDCVNSAISSKNTDTFKAIRDFGPACGVDECFKGTIYLLCKYSDDLKKLLVQNAKAGGDSSSRAMAATMIVVVNKEKNNMPIAWKKINHVN